MRDRVLHPGEQSARPSPRWRDRKLEFPDGHVMWHEPWTHQVENIATREIKAMIVEDTTSL